MGKITEDMILEAVLFLGTPSKKQIYDYVQGQTDLNRCNITSKTGERLKSLVTYGILAKLTIDGVDYYHYPDAVPCPNIETDFNRKRQVKQYIDSLPEGSTFTIEELRDKLQCTRWIVYDAIRDTKHLIIGKSKKQKLYTKGASA